MTLPKNKVEPATENNQQDVIEDVLIDRTITSGTNHDESESLRPLTEWDQTVPSPAQEDFDQKVPSSTAQGDVDQTVPSSATQGDVDQTVPSSATQGDVDQTVPSSATQGDVDQTVPSSATQGDVDQTVPSSAKGDVVLPIQEDLAQSTHSLESKVSEKVEVTVSQNVAGNMPNTVESLNNVPASELGSSPNQILPREATIVSLEQEITAVPPIGMTHPSSSTTFSQRKPQAALKVPDAQYGEPVNLLSPSRSVSPVSTHAQFEDGISEEPKMVKTVAEVLRRRKKNILVWKDKDGNLFTTLESSIQTNISDVLDAFYFDRPELIIRLMGTQTQDETSLYRNRELPDLEYSVSYTGKGGVNILPQPLRRRLIQLISEIGAWIVSDYDDGDILESTNQPYVAPTQLKPQLHSDSSSWPPNLTYSSVHLANKSSSQRLIDARVPYFECVLVTNGDSKTLDKLLELTEATEANVIVIKGSGGLADILASERSYTYEDIVDLFPDDLIENSDTNSRLQTDAAVEKTNQTLSLLLKNLTLFEADLELNDYGLGRAILMSIFKAHPEKKRRLLKLCVDLDCFDIAEKYILTDSLPIQYMLPVVQSAFMHNRTKFIEYFLRMEAFEKMKEKDGVMPSILTDSRAMSFTDVTLWQTKHHHKHDHLGVCDHLFRQCLVSHKLDLSRVFWLKTRNPLASSLLAFQYLTKQAKKEKNHIVKSNLKTAAIQYQNLSAAFVNACYDKDEETTLKMITHKIDQFNGQSCIDLALSSSNLDFLVQPACVTLQRRVWRWGNLWDFYTDNPNPQQVLLRNRSHLKNNARSQNERNGEDKNIQVNEKKRQERVSIISALRKYYLLLCVPMTMFFLHGLGLLIFIYSFGLTFLGRFEQFKFHWLEAYLVSFVLVVTAQEMYEMYRNYKEKTFTQYLSGGWNIVDLISVTLFYLGAVLRLISYYGASEFWFDCTRVAFSLDFISFTLRLLHNCYSSPVLGPTCAMIIKTVAILTRYLYIFAIFWASYAVASEAILYPQNVLSYYTFFYLFRKAYWQMFGELFLDEINAGKSLDNNSLECTNDPALFGTYEMIRCPTPLGRYYVPVLLAVYVMFTNVLLTSLITASFTKSIEKIQLKARKLWRFQFFLLTRDFSKVLFLPLPFTLISIFARLADDDKRNEDGFSVSDKKSRYMKNNWLFINEYKTDVINKLRELVQTLDEDNQQGQPFDNQSTNGIFIDKLEPCFQKLKKISHKDFSMKKFVDKMETIILSVKDLFKELETFQIMQKQVKFINDNWQKIMNPNLGSQEQECLKQLKDQIMEYKKLTLSKDPFVDKIKIVLNMKQNLTEIVNNLKTEPQLTTNLISEFNKSCKYFEFMIEEEIQVQDFEQKLAEHKELSVSSLDKLNQEFHQENQPTNDSWNEKIDLERKFKALQGIKRRADDFNQFLKMKNHEEKNFEQIEKYNDELKDKAQGVWVALKFYKHIHLRADVTQLLNELEFAVLQEKTNISHYDIKSNIKDLEMFVLHNCIEPKMQKEWRQSEALERNTGDGSQNKSNKVEHSESSKDGKDNDDDLQENFSTSKKINSLKETQVEDEDFEDWSDDELMPCWVPMHKYSGESKEKTETELSKIKFNHKDQKHNIERRSYLGRYKLNDAKVPLNPMWKSITKSRQDLRKANHEPSRKLPRSGPNHFGIPIITRIKLSSKAEVKKHEVELEFLVQKVMPAVNPKQLSENQPPVNYKYMFPEVLCSPDKDPFIEFFNVLPNGNNTENVHESSKPQSRWQRAVKLLKPDRSKLKRKSKGEIKMKPCQKIKTIYIGPVNREEYMTEHQWMEIRAINYHNPHSNFQKLIDNAIKLSQNYQWIGYKEYKEVDNIIDTGDIFSNICRLWGAYFERRPPTASTRPATAMPGTSRRSAHLSRARTAHNLRDN